MTEVVAALIVQNGRFLICRRPPHKARGLLWEFVGGKVEPNETCEEALIRECREELDIALRVLSPFMSTVHRYPDIEIRLNVFLAEICSGEPKLLEHTELKWIAPDEIKNYEFCPADKDILNKITEVYGN